MEAEKRRALCAAGIQVEDAIERFMGDEEMFERFLHKFMQGSTYTRLCTAIWEKDGENAFRAAHTLKGIAGNLSMRRLFLALEPLVEALRGRDMTRAKELMPTVEQAYSALLEQTQV